MTNKKGLGKGLAALMGEARSHYATNTAINEGDFAYIKISDIAPNELQPRKIMDEDALNELANSINENGVLQPILLQKLPDNKYRIIAGERRWRASKIIGLDKIPALIKNYSEAEEFEVALIENIQRQDLNAMEEAIGYLRLIKDFDYTQEQIAKVIGKSRSHIANVLRLNSLPPAIQEKISSNTLSVGHAKVLVGLPDCEKIADLIVKKALNVRQTENYVKSYNKEGLDADNFDKEEKATTRKNKKANSDPELAKLEKQISEKLSAKVFIEFTEFGGKITVEFEGLDQLDSILSSIK